MRTLNHITLREWKRIFRIPNYYAVLLVIPPLIFLFYGFIYQNQFVKELPIAVWDEDHSAVSRTIIQMLDERSGLTVAASVHSEQELLTQIQQGTIYGAVHIPAHLEADAKRGKNQNISLYTNAALLVPSQLIYKDAAQVLIKAGLAVVLQKSERSGMPESQAMALVQPIKLTTTTLFNPEFNYKEYLVPGLVTVGIQMAIIIASVLLINLESVRGTLPELLRISTSASAIIIGKTLAHLCIAWLNFLLIFMVIFPFFDIHGPGSLAPIFVLYTLLALACIGIGILVSSITDNLLFTADLALFYTAPAFVFSGYTFPRSAMPWYDQWYAAAMPYTHFLDGFIKLFYMDLPLSAVKNEAAALLIFTGLCYPLAVIFMQRRIQKLAKA